MYFNGLQYHVKSGLLFGYENIRCNNSGISSKSCKYYSSIYFANNIVHHHSNDIKKHL